MQYVADEDAYAYVEAGDLKLDRRLTHTGHFEFPLAHYHGAMICFDLETADAGLAAQMKGFPVSAAAICRKFCEGKYPRVLHGHPAVEHIFSELYAVPEQIRIPYFKLKVMELLLFLEAAELPRRIDEPAYFYRTQVEKVKAIERYLTEQIFKKPVFVTDYPKEIKAFYMKMNEDNKTVAAMDLLVPAIGEIIGGSQREDDLAKLEERITELGMKPEDYDFYLDLRKYGSTRHAGFGLGFERMVMYATGIANIRDVIPYPRTVGKCQY